MVRKPVFASYNNLGNFFGKYSPLSPTLPCLNQAFRGCDMDNGIFNKLPGWF